MRTAVVLMTYGAPRTLDDVGTYLTRVRGGKAPSPELVADFTERYRRIGMSPIVRVTEAQASAVEGVLGAGFRVVAGMRYSEPSIAACVEALASYAPDVVAGVVLSPQWSPALMGGYELDLRGAVDAALPGVPVVVARAWHAQPSFVAVLASLVREARAGLGDVPVVLTAHSLPRRVFEAEREYVESLRETAELVARAVPLADWSWAYQSAGHTQEEWLRPDLVELFPGLAAAGQREVLVAPVQFLSDHLEVLYDLDVAAAAQARAADLRYHRVRMPNASPAFAAALAEVVRDVLALAVPG